MDLNRVDLNLLVAFDALMAERSVSAAADRLAVGQSAMSSTLARLRKLLDDPVLVREGRTMVATPLAESLVEPVREALTRIETILAGPLRFDPLVDHRTFTVMTSDYVAVTLLRPLMAHLNTEAPGIRLRIEPVTRDFPEQLARNKIDMVVVPPEVFTSRKGAAPDELSYAPLYRDRYVLAVDEDHPDVGDSITLAQFSSMPYLATAYELVPSLAEAQLDAQGIPRRLEVTSGFGIAPFLLRGTLLMTLIPELVARSIAEGAHLRLLEPPMPLQPVTETMVWSSRFDSDTAHSWLRDRLRTLAAHVTNGHR